MQRNYSVRANLKSLNMHELIKAAPYYRVINRTPKKDILICIQLHNNLSNEVHEAYFTLYSSYTFKYTAFYKGQG